MLALVVRSAGRPETGASAPARPIFAALQKHQKVFDERKFMSTTAVALSSPCLPLQLHHSSVMASASGITAADSTEWLFLVIRF